MLKVTALIPARSVSKRIKDKNLTKVCGKTLLEWSINACERCDFLKSKIVKLLSEPVLSSEGIAKVFFSLDTDGIRVELVEMLK